MTQTQTHLSEGRLQDLEDLLEDALFAEQLLAVPVVGAGDVLQRVALVLLLLAVHHEVDEVLQQVGEVAPLRLRDVASCGWGGGRYLRT